MLVTNVQRHISFNPLRLEMGLERQIHKYQQLLYRLHFFREDIMTISSETYVVAHTCSPSTLVQGQEDSKVSLGCIARPGLTHRMFVCTPILLQLL